MRDANLRSTASLSLSFEPVCHVGLHIDILFTFTFPITPTTTMASDRPSGGLSLYADLVDKKPPATISSEPVIFTQQQKEEQIAAARKKLSAGRSR
jgi:hypothetical protein